MSQPRYDAGTRVSNAFDQATSVWLDDPCECVNPKNGKPETYCHMCDGTGRFIRAPFVPR